MFFNGTGIPIGFEVEDGKRSSKGGKGGPPGPRSGKPGGGPDKDQDRCQQGERKRGTDKFKRYGDMDRDMEANQDDSMEDNLEKNDRGTRMNSLKEILLLPLLLFIR